MEAILLSYTNGRMDIVCSYLLNSQKVSPNLAVTSDVESGWVWNHKDDDSGLILWLPIDSILYLGCCYRHFHFGFYIILKWHRTFGIQHFKQLITGKPKGRLASSRQLQENCPTYGRLLYLSSYLASWLLILCPASIKIASPCVDIMSGDLLLMIQ